MTRYCRNCGHEAGRHEHYRQGSDCAQRGCKCPRFRRWWDWRK